MMQKLRCTWSELQAEPAFEMAIIGAFAQGENDGDEVLRDRRDAQSRAQEIRK